MRKDRRSGPSLQVLAYALETFLGFLFAHPLLTPLIMRKMNYAYTRFPAGFCRLLSNASSRSDSGVCIID